MSQCEYSKPHPRHHWWIDGSTTPVTNYQQCEGVSEAEGGGPSGFTQWWQISKQASGEWELWKREQEVGASSHPTGEKHLHFLYGLKGHWEWVVRPGGSSPLCKTPRCRAVTIKEIDRAPK